MRRYAAELIGTFTVVFAGGGAVVVGGDTLGPIGAAAALGLGVAAMTLVLAPISGAHLNPAVSIGAALSGRLGWRALGPYVAAQVAGGLFGAAAVRVLAGQNPDKLARFVSAPSASHTILSAFFAEVVLTAILTLVILYAAGTAPKRAPSWDAAQSGRSAHFGQAAAAGTAVTLVHLVAAPVVGLTSNPARALGAAAFSGVLDHLWLFAIAPIAGGVAAALALRALWPCAPEKPIAVVAAGTWTTSSGRPRIIEERVTPLPRAVKQADLEEEVPRAPWAEHTQAQKAADPRGAGWVTMKAARPADVDEEAPSTLRSPRHWDIAEVAARSIAGGQ